MICLHLSLSFKSLSIPFIVNHIYCHYKYTNDQRSSIIFICLQIYSHSYLLFSCMLLYTLLLLCLFIVHPHRYRHYTEEPPPFFSIQLDVSLVNRHRVLPSLEMSRDYLAYTDVICSIYDSIVDTDEPSTPARS